jgi:hypothetical protein
VLGSTARRATTWLLLAWILGGGAVLVAAWVRPTVCPWGQAPCMLGPQLPSTVATAVVLVGFVIVALLWIWDLRRRVIPDDAPGPVPRPVRVWWLLGGSVVGVIIGAHLLLLAPMISDPFCATPVHLNRYMAYVVNCDSALMQEMADHPELIFEPENMRQSRPGYLVLSTTANGIIGPIADRLGIDRAYGQDDDAYIPLVLINIAAASTALALFVWLLRGVGASWTVSVALGAVLIVNDLTKPFMWTPHQQMFVLLVPLLTVVAVRWVLTADPSWRALAVAGLGLGFVVLVYASVLTTVAAVAIVLAFQGVRAIGRIAALVASAALLPVAWIAVCTAVSGSYYNHEATVYHQFRWLVESSAPGDPSWYQRFKSYAVFTVAEVLAAATPFLLVVTAVVVIAVLARARLVPAEGSERSTLIGTGLALLLGLAFCWAIGTYTYRLAYHIVPPLLLLIGWVATRSTRLGRVPDVAICLLAAVWIGLELTAHGPYS